MRNSVLALLEKVLMFRVNCCTTGRRFGCSSLDRDLCRRDLPRAAANLVGSPVDVCLRLILGLVRLVYKPSRRLYHVRSKLDRCVRGQDPILFSHSQDL